MLHWLQNMSRRFTHTTLVKYYSNQRWRRKSNFVQLLKPRYLISLLQNGACLEDQGFAIKGWTKVRFENSGVIIDQGNAIAMGNYFFTSPEGEEVKVEYTFGYLKTNLGALKINLHHSSMPAN